MQMVLTAGPEEEGLRIMLFHLSYFSPISHINQGSSLVRQPNWKGNEQSNSFDPNESEKSPDFILKPQPPALGGKQRPFPSNKINSRDGQRVQTPGHSTILSKL
jgi:hypothetical protein